MQTQHSPVKVTTLEVKEFGNRTQTKIAVQSRLKFRKRLKSWLGCFASEFVLLASGNHDTLTAELQSLKRIKMKLILKRSDVKIPAGGS